MQRPKLRDNQGRGQFELYPLGQIPDEVIYNIAKWMTYYFAVGKSDITGDDWGDIFARAIGGGHLDKPVGLADVIYEGMAWSTKSVKSGKPFRAKAIRLISGRNSPDFSYGVTDPHADIQSTGAMVLSIWNERINVAKGSYEPLRTVVLVRNFNTLEFSLFEHETVRYNPLDYEWRKTKIGTFWGYEKASEKHRFTWQPSGSQFTILCEIPPSARKFKIKRPGVLDFEETMSKVGFDANWVTFL